MTTIATPTYIMNALAVDFDSIYAMGDASFTEVFKAIESSGLKPFPCPSLNIYVPELFNIYEKRVVISDGELIFIIGGNEDEGFFGKFFQLPSDGLTNFSSIEAVDIEEMLTLFSTSIDVSSSNNSNMVCATEESSFRNARVLLWPDIPFTIVT